jgi:hypothetical protein
MKYQICLVYVYSILVLCLNKIFEIEPIFLNADHISIWSFHNFNSFNLKPRPIIHNIENKQQTFFS